MPIYRRGFPATHRSLSDARAEINDWVGSSSRPERMPDSIAADVDVVITELAANVIDHTSSPWFGLMIDVDSDRVRIEVSNVGLAELVPAVEQWSELAVDDRGRGLRIVRAICDRITVGGADMGTTVTCEIDLANTDSSAVLRATE